jgi:hypothetical protein
VPWNCWDCKACGSKGYPLRLWVGYERVLVCMNCDSMTVEACPAGGSGAATIRASTGFVRFIVAAVVALVCVTR